MSKWCFKGCGPDLVLPASQVQATSYAYQLAYIQWLIEQLSTTVSQLSGAVVANPDHTGDEADLEYIKIGETVYKIPSGTELDIRSGTAKLVQSDVEYANIYWTSIGEQMYITFGDLSGVIMLGSASYTITGLPEDLVLNNTYVPVNAYQGGHTTIQLMLNISKSANADAALEIVEECVSTNTSTNPPTFTTSTANSYYLQYASQQTIILTTFGQ